MGKMYLSQEFKEFLKLLNRNKVEYLLVGGYAVGYYGYKRLTGDIDIFISNDVNNIDKIISTLAEFGFKKQGLSRELFSDESNIVKMGSRPFRIIILTMVSGLDFNQAYQNKEIGRIDDVEVNIISLEHLKINKKASGRHKDLDDLENLP